MSYPSSDSRSEVFHRATRRSVVRGFSLSGRDCCWWLVIGLLSLFGHASAWADYDDALPFNEVDHFAVLPQFQRMSSEFVGDVPPPDEAFLPLNSQTFLSLSDGQAEHDLETSPWTWQLMPGGLMYKAYLAGVKESRFSTAYLYNPRHGWIWDSTLGGQVGVIRYGSQGSRQPQGFQLDMEGAVFPRLDVESGDDLISADFRFGVPFTWRRDKIAVKFGYYHFSSHLGDEFMLKHLDVERINYVRDGLLTGVSVMLTDDLRAYGEVGYAINADGGARPWELQFGSEYSPAQSTGFWPVPYAAINGNLRQEVRFGGNVNIVGGWQWRSAETNHLWRFGFQYFNGKSSQYAFFKRFERLTGLGLWFDY